MPDQQLRNKFNDYDVEFKQIRNKIASLEDEDIVSTSKENLEL